MRWLSLLVLFFAVSSIVYADVAGQQIGLPATIIVALPPEANVSIGVVGVGNGTMYHVFRLDIMGSGPYNCTAYHFIVDGQNITIVDTDEFVLGDDRIILSIYTDRVVYGSRQIAIPIPETTGIFISYNGSPPQVQIIDHENGSARITALDIGEYQRENGTFDRLKELAGNFLFFFGIIGAGLLAFVKIVWYSVEAVWNVARVVFYYASIVLFFFEKYVLPNLTLALGLYFLLTVGDMVRKLPKEGLDAVVDWGRLWYNHVMAVVRFFEWLFQTIIKIINAISNVIEAIWPL